MMDLSVVIVNHETPGLLARCLASVKSAASAHPGLRFETIVVDNGSRDDSLDVLQESMPSARRIALVRNRGFAAGVNRALAIRRGRHILLLNSDAEIGRELLVRGVCLLDGSPDIGVLGAALRHPDGRAQRSVHGFPGLGAEWLSGRSRWRGSASESPVSDRPVADPVGFQRGRDVEAVRGAVFFVRGELLEKVGFLDEGYFFFLEETDFCWRVREAGFRVVHCEALQAAHRLGASSKARVPLATRIEFHRSLYRFLDRRRGSSVATIVRTMRIIRNAGLVLGLCLAGPVSAGARSRLEERWGLLLWHLRGRPDGAGLESALGAGAGGHGVGEGGGRR